ncbi:endonuclease MutS2 [Helicovermis profundi]|uniref:Mannonate oxidoreductase n=1 Tax=Helicovermis profundi TaxID=3065157 RepID=A0AAU9E532_9FIRM|nr:mannonate oxidoreductase [Clostridia bacterium S502]
MNNEKMLNLLGYNEVKESVKKYTSSNLGKNLVENMFPSIDPKVILRNNNEIKEAVKIIKEGRSLGLGGISDIRPYISKVEKGSFLYAEELLKVSDFLRCIRNLKKSIEKYEYIAPILCSYSIGLGTFKTLENDIEFCIEGSMVHSRASTTLSKLRKKIEALHSKRIDRLNKFLSASKNEKYLQENFYSHRNDRYVVPIKSSYRNFVDGTIIDSSASGSTIYVEIDSIKDLTIEIIMLKAQELEECNQILMSLSESVGEHINEIKSAIYVLGKYDFIMAKGKYSVEIKGNDIEIKDDETINLIMAKHPMLGKEAVPLNIEIGTDYRTLIITGPNTGGKTITLKTVGLMVLLTQSGILPPVAKGSSISIFKQILVDIGDSQSIEQSLSTFSGHMTNMVNIVRKSSRRTLVLVDEIGSGTDPKDGASLGIAILEEIYNRGSITLASTHYSKIKEYSEIHDGFMNASMDFNRETLKPLYRLLIGVAGNSNALWISKELGLPDKIIDRVNKINSTHEIVKSGKITKFSKKKNRVEELIKQNSEIDETRMVYCKGDRIIVNETGEHSIIFDHNFKEKTLVIFKNGKYTEIMENRVTLDQRAEVLYPVGYDLDQLFISFKSRKLDKDIAKGRFKNLKELNERMKSIN